MHFTLNISIDRLSHSRRTSPFIWYNLFFNEFSPILVLLLLIVQNVVCCLVSNGLLVCRLVSISLNTHLFSSHRPDMPLRQRKYSYLFLVLPKERMTQRDSNCHPLELQVGIKTTALYLPKLLNYKNCGVLKLL